MEPAKKLTTGACPAVVERGFRPVGFRISDGREVTGLEIEIAEAVLGRSDQTAISAEAERSDQDTQITHFVFARLRGRTD